MNNKLFVIFFLILFFPGCQTTCHSGKTTFIKIGQSEVNMGTLAYKEPCCVDIPFQNTGEQALIIYNIETSCGCTVAGWNRKPVKPGDNGTITLTYDSEFPGFFRKTITVFYNGVNSPDTILLKGEVAYPEYFKTTVSSSTKQTSKSKRDF
ncbi:MAG: DUF1573 domain-containing protein [Prolixibacteraceae bacterium]|nr:DUF1573 domain-containing protein [Prolixibacteraceae bacterium]